MASLNEMSEKISSAEGAWESLRDRFLGNRVGWTRQMEMQIQMIFYAGIVAGLGMQRDGADADALTEEVTVWLEGNE